MNKLKQHILLVSFILLKFVFFAQNEESELKEKAEKLFNKESYVEATVIYSQLLAFNARDPFYNYRYGVCLLYNSRKKVDAIKHLTYASKEAGFDPEVYFYLGKAYHLNYDFNDAISNYNKYKSAVGSKVNKALQVDRHIQMSENGKRLLGTANQIIVQDKKEIENESFFRIYNLKNIGGDILVNAEFQSKLDKKKNHVPLIHFPANPSMIFYSSYGENENSGKDIFIRRKLPDGTWSLPQTINGGVNTPYDEDFPYMHPTGKYLYFCSKGHNSMGGYDVFRSPFDKESNTFGPAENLDFAISSPDDDMFYIIDSLDKNAYFASRRQSLDGKIHVYQLKVDYVPNQIAVVKSAFSSTLNPKNKKISVEVFDFATNNKIGTFNANEKGFVIITFPKGGKYTYHMQVEGVTQIFKSVVSVPFLKEFKALKQKMIHENGASGEQVTIVNMFDEEVEDPIATNSEIARVRAELNPNIDQFDVKAMESQANNDALFSSIGYQKQTDQEVKDNIKKLAEKQETQADNLKKLQQKSLDKIADNTQKIAELQDKLKITVADGEKKQGGEKKDAFEQAAGVSNKIKELNQENKELLAFHDTLEKPIQLATKDAVETRKMSDEINHAIDTKNSELITSKINANKDKILELKTDNAELPMELLVDKVVDKRDDLKKLSKSQDEYLKMKVAAKKELLDLDIKLAEAKSKDQPDIKKKIDEKIGEIDYLDKELENIDKKIKSKKEELSGVEEKLSFYQDLFNSKTTSKNTSKADAISKIESATSKNANTLIAYVDEQAKNQGIDVSKQEYVEVKKTNPDSKVVEKTKLTKEQESLISSIAVDYIGNLTTIKNDENLSSDEKIKALQSQDKQAKFLIAKEIAKADEILSNNPSDKVALDRKDKLVKLKDALGNNITASQQELESKFPDKYPVKPMTPTQLANKIKPNHFAVLKSIEGDGALDNQTIDKAQREDQEFIRLASEERNKMRKQLEVDPDDETIKEELKIIEVLLKETDQRIERRNKGMASFQVPDNVTNNDYNPLDAENKTNEGTNPTKTENDIAKNTENKSNTEKPNVENKSSENKTSEGNNLTKTENDVAKNTENKTNTEQSNVENNSTENKTNEVTNPTKSENDLAKNTKNKTNTEQSNVENKSTENKTSEGNNPAKTQDDITKNTENKINTENSNDDNKSTENKTIEGTNPTKSEIDIAKNTENNTYKIVENRVVDTTTINKVNTTYFNNLNNIEANSNYSEITKTEKKILEEKKLQTSIDNQLKKIDKSISKNPRDSTLVKEKEQLIQVKETSIAYVDESKQVLVNEKAQAISQKNLIKTINPKHESVIASTNDSLTKKELNTKFINQLEQRKASNEKRNSANENLDLQAENKVITEIIDSIQNNKSINPTKNENLVVENNTKANIIDSNKVNNAGITITENQENKTVVVNYASSKEQELSSKNQDLLNKLNDKKISKSDKQEAIKELNKIQTEQLEIQEKELKTKNRFAEKVKDSSFIAKNKDIDKEIKAINTEIKSAKNDEEKIALNNELIDLQSTKSRLIDEEINKDLASILPSSSMASFNTKENISTKKRQISVEIGDLESQIERDKKRLSEAKKKDKLKYANAIVANEKQIAKLKQDLDEHTKAEKIIASNEKSIQSPIIEKSSFSDQEKNEFENLDNLVSLKEQYQDIALLQDSVNIKRKEIVGLKSELVTLENEYKSKPNPTTKQALIDKKTRIEKEEKELKEMEQNYSVDLASYEKATNTISNNKGFNAFIANFEGDDKQQYNLAENTNQNTEKAIPPFEILPVPVLTAAAERIVIEPTISDGLVYRVQVGAFKYRLKDRMYSEFTPVTGEEYKAGITRYITGYFSSFKSADEAKRSIRSIGYKDAFVVVYCNGQRISLAKAKKLIASGECVPKGGSDFNVKSSVTTNEKETKTYTESSSSNEKANNTKPTEKQTDLSTKTNEVVNNSKSNKSTEKSSNSSGNEAKSSYLKVKGAVPAKAIETMDGLFYTVQIGAYSKPAVAKQLKHREDLVTKRLSDGLIRYNVGVFNSTEEAAKTQSLMVEKGIKDAFITAYYKGERISLIEASELLKSNGNSILEIK